MKIDVTRDDIDRGRFRLCEYCPVALAIRRAIGEEWWISVQPKVLLVHGHAGFKAFDLPAAATEFIRKFDDLERPGPFSFDLPIDHLVAKEVP